MNIKATSTIFQTDTEHRILAVVGEAEKDRCIISIGTPSDCKVIELTKVDFGKFIEGLSELHKLMV